MSYKQTAKDGMSGIAMLLYVLLLLGIIGVFVGLTRPVWLGFERKAFVASHQYVESARSAIALYNAQCIALPEGPQRDALRAQIAGQKAKIDPSEYPRVTGEC